MATIIQNISTDWPTGNDHRVGLEPIYQKAWAFDGELFSRKFKEAAYNLNVDVETAIRYTMHLLLLFIESPPRDGITEFVKSNNQKYYRTLDNDNFVSEQTHDFVKLVAFFSKLVIPVLHEMDTRTQIINEVRVEYTDGDEPKLFSITVKPR